MDKATALPSPWPNSRLARPRRRRALIGLTPLIDVVFILLVFFMLASSFLDWRAIELDAPVRAAGSEGLEGALLVQIRPDGLLRLAAAPISLEDLAARVREHLETTPDQRVLIEPASGVPLQRTVSVLDRLKAAGVTEMRLISNPAAPPQ